MIIVRCLFLMLFATCFYGSDTLATDFAAPLASHNFFTPELKPSPDTFKLAKSTFLPETYDDLGLSGRHNTKYDFNKNDCSAYPLASCPSNGKCTKCPVGAGYKLDSCNTGYTKSGDTCTKNAVFCETNATTYKNKIPDDYFCAKVTNNPQCSNSSLTNCDKCYTSCYKINCSGYPLDCKTIDKTALHIATTEICSNCKSSLSNCIKTYCKITACADGYKINAAGTACVEKEDICPNGYYKSCETGTQGDPKYTEKGTACYQCKPKTEDKPQRECKLSPGNVCIYSDGNYNICIGPECSEKEYPYEEDYMLPSCTIAPTYGQWCSKRSCSDDSPLCSYYLDCSEHISPQCTITNVRNSTTNTCSYHDEKGLPSSCKITGDYSAYECPTGQKCLFTLTDDNDLSGRCVDASITEADIQKAIIDITSHACSFDNENADSKKVLFYLGSDNNLSELFSSLDRLKAWKDILIPSNLQYGINKTTICKNSDYNQCINENNYKFTPLVNISNNWKDCIHPKVYDPYKIRWVDIVCEQRDSYYISGFCKMDYCAIDLEKMNEYPLSNRTKEILNTYVLHDLKQSSIESGADDYYKVAVYTIHANFETVSHHISFPNPAIEIAYYLQGCGACSQYIDAIDISDYNISEPKGESFNGGHDWSYPGFHGCVLNTFSLHSVNSYSVRPSAFCTIQNKETSNIYRMLFNPNTIELYKEKTSQTDCQENAENYPHYGNYCTIDGHLNNIWW